ncbi:MAG: Hsp70 family protein [Myxococcaceae bacterium]|nr:Hsp70 family protein [Myxococcaceae bacterium]
MAFIIGIDLGTSNCAVAFTDPKGGAAAPVVDFPVPQLARPGEHVARALYPSVVYLPFEGEFPAGSTAMPWSDGARVTGEFARWQAGRVPHRAVASAKSWLIHPGVDRQAPILPWGAPADVPRLSPVAAQAELLSHLAQAWNRAHPDAPLAEQDVVLTIPASFDEAARALTLQAARDAGIPLARLTLLEEPQAAFYDFTSRHRSALAQALSGVRLVLVVDVGGGTTDFSLVQVAMLPEGPALQRLAVGDHLLLGGDNMDAALAKRLETKLLGDGRTFSAPQWAQAVQQARTAKEALLAANGAEQHAVSIVAQGSKLIGGTLSSSLSRAEVLETVVQGFFPVVPPDATPASTPRGGVVELGLPYAKDPAITRHLVAFLRAHAEAGFKALGQPAESGLPRPDAILLNGGVFNSPALADALVAAVSALFPAQPKVPLLPHDSLDLAVARGAAYSGLARRALGKKIGGGAPRAFYALVSDGTGGRQGVCLVPRGLEEGSTVELQDRTFQLTLGRPVQFQLYSTTADRLDAPGALVPLDDEVFKPLPPIHTILAGAKGSTIGVHLVSMLSEVGTLALSCVAGEQRWRLEFELKGAAKSQGVSITEAMPARFADATVEIDRVFGTRPLPVKPQDVKQLFKTLERLLGPRDTWGLPVLRELWTALLAGASKRRRSVDHEKVMFQLLGYSLRPGVGYPLDGWRCEQTFGLFKELVTHHGEQAVWSEFWVLWRRIAGGLSDSAQQAIYAAMEPQLARRVPVGLPVPKDKLKGVQPQGLDEMVRCAASLELLPVAKKAELGAWVASRLASPETTGGPWAWALGRLGARVPVHGAAHRVLSAETAEAWAGQLLSLDPARHDTAAFALALLARRTGDRVRDVDEATRTKVLEHFSRHQVPASWHQLVAEVVQLSAADEARALGDTLPVGLSL